MDMRGRCKSRESEIVTIEPLRVYFSFRFSHHATMPAVPLPALHASHAGTWLRSGQLGANGSTRGIGKGEAIMAAADTP